VFRTELSTNHDYFLRATSTDWFYNPETSLLHRTLELLCFGTICFYCIHRLFVLKLKECVLYELVTKYLYTI